MASEPAVPLILEHLDTHDPGGVRGVYLYGSAVTSGLTVHSDVDLLVIVRRSLNQAERHQLSALLLQVSGWSGHADDPTVSSRRPVELTVLVEHGSPRRIEYQYGEWLRAEIAAGALPRPVSDPDAVVLRATALDASRTLRGPDPDQLLEPVSASELRAAMMGALPDVLAGVDGDERNALLTLARILVTVRTGRIVSKHVAAAQAGEWVPGVAGPLDQARREYLGEDGHSTQDARSAAALLADAIRDEYSQGRPGREKGTAAMGGSGAG